MTEGQTQGKVTPEWESAALVSRHLSPWAGLSHSICGRGSIQETGPSRFPGLELLWGNLLTKARAVGRCVGCSASSGPGLLGGAWPQPPSLRTCVGPEEGPPGGVRSTIDYGLHSLSYHLDFRKILFHPHFRFFSGEKGKSSNSVGWRQVLYLLHPLGSFQDL